MPWAEQGSRGATTATVFYDLGENLYEDGDASNDFTSRRVQELVSTLHEIHNRGYARELNLMADPEMIVHPGWHNLRNDVTGEIGFKFRLKTGSGEKVVTHLGMFDDPEKDLSVRDARAIPSEHNRDQPAVYSSQNKKRRIVSNHVLRLLRVESDGQIQIARCEISPEDPGQYRDSFRYIRLNNPVSLQQNSTYVLLMSTVVADGDRFRDPASFDGLSPLIHPHVVVQRSILLRNETVSSGTVLPAFEDLHNSYSRYRIPVGPTLLFER